MLLSIGFVILVVNSLLRRCPFSMKAWKKIVPAVAILGLALTACGQNSSDNASNNSSSQATSSQTSKASSSESSSKSTTDSASSASASSSSAASSSSSAIKTKLGNEKLPQNHGVKEQQNVQTKVEGDKNNYTINYMNGKSVYATYTKHSYSSASAASQQVGYQNAEDVKGLPMVNLGYNIKGYQDRGAGQEYIQANFGNWSLVTHGSNFGKYQGVADREAKSIVSFIQNNQLPVPQKNGSIKVENDGSATVTWQAGMVVYSVKANQFNTALQMVTSIK
jgi:hypothetical protein